MGNRFEGGGETGRMYEAKFMGKPTVDPKFLLAVEKISQRELGRRAYKEAMFKLFKESYLNDPTDPPGEHLKELRLATSEALGLRSQDESALGAYTAVGTELDKRFGTDGFIEYTDPQTGKTARVTLDTTLNRRKLEEQGDDDDHLMVSELPDAVQDDEAYLEALEKLGSKVASRLLMATAPDEKRKAA